MGVVGSVPGVWRGVTALSSFGVGGMTVALAAVLVLGVEEESDLAAFLYPPLDGLVKLGSLGALVDSWSASCIVVSLMSVASVGGVWDASGGGEVVGGDMLDGSEIEISAALPRGGEGACLEVTLHRKCPQDDTLGVFAVGGSKQEAGCGTLVDA